MWKNRKLMAGGLILLLVLSLGFVGLVTAKSNGWDFQKLSGVLKAENGVVYSGMSQADGQTLIESMDPKSGRPTLELDTDVFRVMDDNSLNQVNGEKKSFEVEIESRGQKGTFKFYTISNGGKEIIIPDKYKGTGLVHDKDYTRYILEYDGDLFSIDPLTHKVERVLSDSINGYDKKSLLEKAHETESSLIWASMPTVDLTGKYMAYVTNRKSITIQAEGTEVWIKNFETGEEKAVFDGGIGVIMGWDSKYNLYFLNGENIYQLNVATGIKKVLLKDVRIGSFSEPYLITAKDNVISILNVETSEVKTFRNSKLNIGSDGKISDGNKMFAVEYFPNVDKRDTEILVLDIDSTNGKVITPPTGYFIDGFSWLDSKTLIVNFLKQGTNDVQESYLVDISKLDTVMENGK